MQQEKQSQIKTSKDYASVNDLFIKWVNKEDGYDSADDMKNEEKKRKDPLIVYGVGLKNYFQLHRQVAWAFFWCSILALIQMGIYKSFGGLEYISDMNEFAKLSFGNMGFSTTDCAKNLVDWDGVQTNLYI